MNELNQNQLHHAVIQSADAAPPFRRVAPEQKAAFLEAIGTEIVALGDELIATANRETHLPEARLLGERARTVGQLAMFAGLVRDGAWVEARIDTARPDRLPAPRPDLRRMLIPLGPVTVFGASNFPFAFSVAGGDTASALAAGCPVVVKAHPAHPQTSDFTAKAVLRAAERCALPSGVFALLHGGPEVSLELVRHPLLEAVGFTGSLSAGRALFDAAAARPRPIPVYAEMGSVNPVFVLPGAASPSLAEKLAASVTLGVGQFCTNPGVVVGVGGKEWDDFGAATAAAVAAMPNAPMLTAGLADAYANGVRERDAAGVKRETPKSAQGAVFSTTAAAFLADPTLAREIFGPETLLVACENERELAAVAQSLEGQLTATVHGTPEELTRFATLIETLEAKVGRLIFGGFPTGVEVSPAMQHGGPYPATTDSRTTSVGTAAIARFARPVCWQDTPQNLLPPELQDANPRNIRRLVDSEWTRSAL